jgi:hypothetical protein
MTDKEHALMMMMFTRQNLYVQMLLDMLKRDGIIQGDDVPAFDSAVINDPANVAALHRVTKQYRSFANQLEMDVPELASLLLGKT